MDDPPPFPLEEFAGHDLVAPISPNGARPGDADGHRQGTGPDGEQHQEDADVAFLGSLETNVTASLGQSAFLRCRLSSAHQQVSRRRRRQPLRRVASVSRFTRLIFHAFSAYKDRATHIFLQRVRDGPAPLSAAQRGVL